MKKLLLLLIFIPGILVAQKKGPFISSITSAICTGYGTVPDESIPVCGTQVFHQDSVTTCIGPDINPTECIGNGNFPSTRSFWYRFKCYQPGTLGFLLKPITPSDDYDFIVFDITGHNPVDVFTDHSLVLTLNGTGTVGPTGCAPSGVSLFECYTTPGNPINKMPSLIAGHTYLLMVTNYSNSPLGYNLVFTGGDAGISDLTPPAIDHVDGGCNKLNVVFTTDVKCNSVTATGSEFTINPGNIKPTSVSSNCQLGNLAITNLSINLPTTLVPGNYTLVIDHGTDANTFTNVCDNEIAPGTTINFTVTRPKGNFALPPETCKGTATNFSSSSDPLPGNLISEYHWDFGDPASGVLNTSTAPAPAHTFTATGNFLVQHWIVNSVGCNSDTSAQMVTVIPLHATNLVSGNSTFTICINKTITPIIFDISGGATGITAPSTFNLPAGVTAALVGTRVTIAGAPTVAGVFNYTITTTGNSCAPVTFTGIITVTEDATLIRSSLVGTDAQELCRNSTITDITYDFGGSTVTANVSGLPAGVTWSITGNRLTITGSPTVVSGSFTYTVSTTGPCVTPSLTGTILVNALPTAAFSSTAPRCETRIISFNDGSAANVGALDQWTWDFGDLASGPINNASALQNPTHIYANAGTYTVKLTVRNDKGCISNPISSAVINIDNRPKAGYIIPAVCLNDTYAQFTDTSIIAAGNIANWSWSFGDPGSGINNTSPLQNPQHSYTAVGNYPVQLIITSNAGCTDTILHNLSVNGSFPVAGFNVNSAATLCSSDSVAITNTSSVFPGMVTKLEIQWDYLGNPGAVQTITIPVSNGIYRHKYPTLQTTQTYSIRITAYSGGVCSNSAAPQTVTVYATPVAQFAAMPNLCLFGGTYLITQGTGTPLNGSGTYSGLGTSSNGTFDPLIAGIGTHAIKFTYTLNNAGSCFDTLTRYITVVDTAHAKFRVVLPSCQGVATTFTDLSTAPAGVTLSNTVWNFNDGNPSENHAPGSTFTHIFAVPNTYNVTMHTQSNSGSAIGCLSTDTSALIRIDPDQHIGLTSANSTQTHCVNVLIDPITYQLSGGATNIVTPISGLPPGVNPLLNGTTLTLVGAPTLAGVYNYTIQTIGNTCQVATTSGVITVDPDHTIALNNGDTAQSVCVNTAIDPITYNLGGGANSITPSGLPPGVNPVPLGNTVTLMGTPTVAGTYNYSLLTGGNGCVKATAIGQIVVHPYPVPAFSFDKTDYCMPNAIVKFNNLTPPTANGTTYAWDFGELSSGNANYSTAIIPPPHWYSSAGPFYVTLSATTIAIPVLNNGLQGCKHDSIIVLNTIHKQAKADFYPDKSFTCKDDLVTFIDRTDQANGTTTDWFWDMGDGTKPGTQSFTHVYADTLEYNIRFYTVNLYGCNSDTLNRLFKVYPNPTVNAGEDRVVLQDIQVNLKPIATGADLQYLWTPNIYLQNGNNNIKNPVALPKENITYTLTVTSRGGCKRNDDVYIKILKPPVIPNTFTPNNDGRNEKWMISYLDDYPDCVVEVFTRTGQLVFKSVKGYKIAWDGKLNGKPLPFDTYYYVIEPGFGRDPITGYITIMK